MDSITGISLESCERNIKFDRKWTRGQLLWVMFNISVTCFDGHTLMTHPTTFSGVAFGAMLITSLWSIIFLFESWNELRSEKLKLKYLTELHETQLASSERGQYLNAKLAYEQMKESLEKSNGSEGHNK